MEFDPVANLHVSRISVLDRLSKQEEVRLSSPVDQNIAEPHIGIQSAYCAPEMSRAPGIRLFVGVLRIYIASDRC